MWTSSKYGAVNLSVAEYIYVNGNTVVAHFPSGENRIIEELEDNAEAVRKKNNLLIELIREAHHER